MTSECDKNDVGPGHCWHELAPTEHGTVAVGLVLARVVDRVRCCWCGATVPVSVAR